jgi:hypothetical protein
MTLTQGLTGKLTGGLTGNLTEKFGTGEGTKDPTATSPGEEKPGSDLKPPEQQTGGGEYTAPQAGEAEIKQGVYLKGPEKKSDTDKVEKKETKDKGKQQTLPGPIPQAGEAIEAKEKEKKEKKEKVFTLPPYDLEEICGKPAKEVPQPGYLENRYNANFKTTIDLVPGYNYKAFCKDLASDLVGILGRLFRDWEYKDSGKEIIATYDLGAAAWYDKFNRTLEVKINKESGKMEVNYKAKEPLPKRVVERDLKKIYVALLENQGYFKKEQPEKTSEKSAKNPGGLEKYIMPILNTPIAA